MKLYGFLTSNEVGHVLATFVLHPSTIVTLFGHAFVETYHPQIKKFLDISVVLELLQSKFRVTIMKWYSS